MAKKCPLRPKLIEKSAFLRQRLITSPDIFCHIGILILRLYIVVYSIYFQVKNAASLIERSTDLCCVLEDINSPEVCVEIFSICVENGLL